MKEKKLPLRMCVSCRQMRDKRELMRVVRSADGVVSIDTTGKMAGRGAYVCKSDECVERAIKTRAFDRALKVELDEQTKIRLREGAT